MGIPGPNGEKGDGDSRAQWGEGKGYPLQYSGLENSMDCIALGSQKVGNE